MRSIASRTVSDMGAPTAICPDPVVLSGGGGEKGDVRGVFGSGRRNMSSILNAWCRSGVSWW